MDNIPLRKHMNYMVHSGGKKPKRMLTSELNHGIMNKQNVFTRKGSLY